MTGSFEILTNLMEAIGNELRQSNGNVALYSQMLFVALKRVFSKAEMVELIAKQVDLVGVDGSLPAERALASALIGRLVRYIG